MKVVLKVSSNNEHCDGGCELALVDLTPEVAATSLQRIAVLREQKSLDPDIGRVGTMHCCIIPP
jgi:hypothetical protein